MATYTCPSGKKITVNTSRCGASSLNYALCATFPAQANSKAASAVFQRGKTWPVGSTVGINFVNGEPWQRAWVQKIITENYAPIVNLKLEFGAIKPDITIAFVKELKAQSLIGTDSKFGSPSMELGWLDQSRGSFEFNGQTYQAPASASRNSEFETGAVVMHEFGHAMGMLHEHQNPRGFKISWNPQKVWDAYCKLGIDWNTVEHNILAQLQENSTNGSEFDAKSIMLYGFPGSITCNYPQGTQANPRLSSLDVEWLKKTYPGKDGVPVGGVTPSTIGAQPGPNTSADGSAGSTSGGSSDGSSGSTTTIAVVDASVNPVIIIVAVAASMLIVYGVSQRIT